MNELHEQYQTLLRRGMPERPKLICRGSWFAHADAEDDRGYYPAFPTDDTRDLLTMHALRWFLADVDAEPVIEHWPARTKPTGNPAPGFDIQYMLRGDNTTCYDAFGETLLTAIIAATTHLEPKP